MHLPVLPEPGAEERAPSPAPVAPRRDEIKARGPITFAPFTERGRSAPGLPYYRAGRHLFGREGESLIASELGASPGRCLARVLAPTLGADADLVSTRRPWQMLLAANAALKRNDAARHELVGLIWYRLRAVFTPCSGEASARSSSGAAAAHESSRWGP